MPGFHELTAFENTTMVAPAARMVETMPTPEPEGPDTICPLSSWFRSEYLVPNRRLHTVQRERYMGKGQNVTAK